jgi:hypothetical protein
MVPSVSLDLLRRPSSSGLLLAARTAWRREDSLQFIEPRYTFKHQPQRILLTVQLLFFFDLLPDRCGISTASDNSFDAFGDFDHLEDRGTSPEADPIAGSTRIRQLPRLFVGLCWSGFAVQRFGVLGQSDLCYQLGMGAECLFALRA